MPTGLLRGLILDMDGTLADTEPYHRDAFNRAFREAGLGWYWSPDEYGRLLTTSGGLHRMHRYAERHPPAAVAPADLDARLREVHRRKSSIYRAAIRRHGPRLCTGIVRLLTEAERAGVAVAVATSSSRRNLETLLRRGAGARLLRQFRVVCTADHVPRMKPDPAIYREVMEALGLSAEHCIAVEDTAAGNQAALRAGMATVITAHRYVRGHDFTGAALVVDHLGDPGVPCRVHRGPVPGRRRVDLRFLEELLSARQRAAGLVGLGGIEPPTSPLSGVRS